MSWLEQGKGTGSMRKQQMRWGGRGSHSTGDEGEGKGAQKEALFCLVDQSIYICYLTFEKQYCHS